MIKNPPLSPNSTAPTVPPSIDAAPMPVRRRGPPPPSFRPSTGDQADLIRGWPEADLPPGHLARQVMDFVEKLDVTALRASRSNLGRKGYDPMRLLAAWIYASLDGVHQASQLARRSVDDVALRWLLGGYRPSQRCFGKFRADSGAFLAAALAQSAQMAAEQGLIDPKALAVDSVRLRANVAGSSIRTVARSTERLEELDAIDVSALDARARAAHERKRIKHEKALTTLAALGRTNYSLTDPEASLMKFPSGAALPGYRLQVGASRSDLRFVVSAFIDGAPTDFGKLEEVVESVLKGLENAGIDVVAAHPQLAADAGYTSEADLRFASEHRSRVDLLVNAADAPAAYTDASKSKRKFSRADFQIRPDGRATCPAGTEMKGPSDHPDGTRTWRGVGCADCPLKARCTTGKERTLSENTRTRLLRDEMIARLDEPGGRQRYSQRIATIEPVFSYIEHVMHFTRVSSRRPETVRAEVFLKLLAYNFKRLNSPVAGRPPGFAAYLRPRT